MDFNQIFEFIISNTVKTLNIGFVLECYNSINYEKSPFPFILVVIFFTFVGFFLLVIGARNKRISLSLICFFVVFNFFQGIIQVIHDIAFTKASDSGQYLFMFTKQTFLYDKSFFYVFLLIVFSLLISFLASFILSIISYLILFTIFVNIYSTGIFNFQFGQVTYIIFVVAVIILFLYLSAMVNKILHILSYSFSGSIIFLLSISKFLKYLYYESIISTKIFDKESVHFNTIVIVTAVISFVVQFLGIGTKK